MKLQGYTRSPFFVPFNASLAYWKGLSIRRLEVLKVLEGANLTPFMRYYFRS